MVVNLMAKDSKSQANRVCGVEVSESYIIDAIRARGKLDENLSQLEIIESIVEGMDLELNSYLPKIFYEFNIDPKSLVVSLTIPKKYTRFVKDKFYDCVGLGYGGKS